MLYCLNNSNKNFIDLKFNHILTHSLNLNTFKLNFYNFLFLNNNKINNLLIIKINLQSTILKLLKIVSDTKLLIKKNKIKKKKIKKLKFSNLRFFKKLVPENYFIFLVYKNFKKKKLFKLFNKRFEGPMPKIVGYSLMLLEPIIILNSLLFILNKIHFIYHRKFIKKVITLLLLILIKYKFIGGFEFYVVGKISVGGNARTRTLNTIFGLRSRSRL
jgi:hypothetical protein